MPTYDYECQKCGHSFEEFQQMSAEPLKKCPECKGKVKRLIGTGAGLLFKGSGFYETDYRSEGYKSAADADSSKEKSSTTAEKKTDADKAKPAEKKDKAAPASPSTSTSAASAGTAAKKKTSSSSKSKKSGT
jgi:putative FmdB family regulatory protein